MLGATSLSTFGIVGTFIETAVVCYLMLASFVGFYNLPGVKKLRPKKSDTSMTGIIYNCLIMQLLGSSLPVLCRILGEQFDSYFSFSLWLVTLYYCGFPVISIIWSFVSYTTISTEVFDTDTAWSRLILLILANASAVEAFPVKIHEFVLRFI